MKEFINPYDALLLLFVFIITAIGYRHDVKKTKSGDKNKNENTHL